MASCKILCFSAFFVLLFSFQLSLTQVDDGTEATTPDPLSTTICTTCACADGVVNCMNLNLTAFFELPDWEALRTFQPISVNLSQNPITHISRISKLPIRELNLSSCEIQTLDDGSFVYLEELTVLDLSNNKITTSAVNRKVFTGPLGTMGPVNFKNMQYLSLANNDLHSLAQDLFLFMPDLLYLDLSDNPLAFIDQVTMGAISDLKYLRELKLSNCELEALPDGLLRRQRKLRRLDISNNRFTTIPSVLKEAPSLVYLNLDRTPIQTLDSSSALGNLTKLQELSLSRLSRLQNVSAGALGGLTDLVILRMNYNPRLTNLDPDFLVTKNEDDEELWPTLRELYLNNNNLSSIDSGMLDHWKELASADFSANPYVCDCKNQWVVDVLVPLLVSISANATINNMVCKKPAELKGLTFAQLNEASKTLVCLEAESITEVQVSNMAIILGIMIGIIVTFPMVLILVLLWKRGFFSRLRRGKHNYDEENEDL